MVRVTDELILAQDQVSLYYTTDPSLGNLPVLIFHGPSTTSNSTLNSSRIQVHVFSAAGFQSYPRITISPNSPFYQSVNHLPRDKQGDEICRGLAFGLLKYFKELPEVVKSGLILQSAHTRNKRPGSAPTLFGEQHAADLAGSMVKLENKADVIRDIESALRPQHINHVDIDLVLPPGSIADFQEEIADENMDDDDFLDPTLKQYGIYAPLVKLFGEVSFLPTSKLRRAPSKPTSLNRSRTFIKDQKMSLRREMGEFVDTEERYVIKMHELVNHIADDFRAKAKSRAFGSFSPSEQDLAKLFPRCLDRILQVNSSFLADIKKVMDATEEEAMGDLETPTISSTGSRHGASGRLKDPTGALAFAKVLLEWFPQFADCYQEYINASQDFPQLISSFTKQQSSFSQRVQQTGEQRLRSAVIEPVQRLPRYSLFIDNIVNCLPVFHPALQPMLKARDVITSICSLDPPATDKSQVVNRLRNIIDSWPTALHPQGRLITAVDVLELPAPFHADPSNVSANAREGMLLLFADCVVLLKKVRECNLSARGVMAEIDKPSAASMMASVTAAAGGEKHIYELTFSGWHFLGDVRFTMSNDGRSIWMTSLRELKDPLTGRERTSPAPTIRNFTLNTGYEGKALRLTEEITRARLEGRFPESERETDKWCLRSTKLHAAEISFHTAIFEEGIDKLVEGRKEPAPIRIVIDHEKGTKGAPVGHYGVEIVANVAVLGGGLKYRLEVDGLHDRVFVDEVVTEHFLPTFAKRTVDLLRSQYNLSNPALSGSFSSFHSKILKSLYVVAEGDKLKSVRSPSPVKMLSSFLSGGFNSSVTSFKDSGSSYTTPSKHSRTPVMANIPPMQAPPVSRTGSHKSSQSVDFDGKGSVRATADETRPDNPLVRLEETFTGYVAALQVRKGNIVGRVLRNRTNADELAINAIYNTFIENPFDNRASSEVTVDVLFVAFEKYLRMAWKDQMGQVMSLQTLDALQERSLNQYPGDFADYVRMVFGEMAPQNRRAFIAIIKLLADLLDGCGNDGDRGALTVAFAELLVTDGEPHDYINLLDRMVEDADRLFEDIGPGSITGFGSNYVYGSISGGRSNHSATASLTSNTSSFRRRFADTLLRQNSKTDADRPSVWRTLSKTNRHVATGEPVQPSSISKGSLNRSRSIESPGRRPVSRDRPAIHGLFDDRPSSSQGTPGRLSTIGASPPPEKIDSVKSLKKSRRSSLSDLKALMAAATLGNISPASHPKGLHFNTPPRTPSPTKIPVADKKSPLFRTGSPNQKENVPLNSRNIGSLTERPQNIMSPSDAVVVKDLWTGKGHSKTVSLSSNIPTLNGSPHARGAPTSRPTSSPGKSSPQKLRLQSPQKLRERLQNEAKAINEAEASLQNELSKIGEEMAKLNAGSSVRSEDIDKLTATVSNLELKIPEVVRDLTSKNDTIKQDLEKSLQASEFKVKGMDQLYKESSAENELLYEKFNGELGKIVKALRGKGKEDKEELIVKVKEYSEDTAKTKKENARLRRELLTLRTLLKASE
ncbi:Rho guanine nucleotide exchange factor gef2 [Lachnellula cervina]|uniref:Rho guanine nucleotide exchange factor gef2 n=1 Tax=Lachnellula cervina TaxID=1316786 RepID=A0A7D8YTL3_9HELO|nr:Rho guanine nucleotide exchange factor gef2 [Lachnellula cervina]